MASNITLYYGSGSPPCWRIQLILEEKNLSGYNSKLVSFEKKEHKSEEILALNPRGQVPTTKIGDIVLCESLATCDYLVDAYKGQGAALVPDDPKQKAVVLQRKYESLVLHKKLFDDFLYFLRMARPEEKTEETLTKKKQALLDELAIWEGYLTKTGAFVAGSDFTVADALLFPTVAFLFRQSAPIEKKFPGITAYYQRMKGRPSVKASWPPHWVDSPNLEALKDLC